MNQNHREFSINSRHDAVFALIMIWLSFGKKGDNHGLFCALQYKEMKCNTQSIPISEARGFRLNSLIILI